ncbi:protein-L-isoaspartate(D-aspartate) O-methyltransferase [Roseibium hamelinense]|uniref:Protein-L-isoaspartate O-methyltransferase n=1 Tax=Roseibium hamelinense TaxID=150831 RepID=A0A562TIN4_9HYPH|nr:protein-L-isoaspartate O-methyltransferase [Roseibium hamelinense]MTI46033.1 protein-L-isoaspartate O-methyltransferase [Roseibium hamelinense]TWI92776.1 protein-L-isoaspartate(D-aspartate) O-methyltransferase [Roseibium hamelinense]
MTDYTQSRIKMVNTQLRTNDVTDHRILDAMEIVPREKFVPASKRVVAYIDEDLPIGPEGSGRVLMKPHVQGKLIQMAAVAADDVVLVVGAGTGYSAAVLSKLAASIVAVEEDTGLAQSAGEVLVELGIENAVVVEGKLTDGLPGEGPYDVIFVNGAVEVLPDALLKQLKDGGRLVVIEGQGGAGQARVYYNSNGVVSSRFGFNASAGVLPGFKKEAEFVF